MTDPAAIKKIAARFTRPHAPFGFPETETAQQQDQIIKTCATLTRRIFAARGGSKEVHMSEQELQAALAVAFAAGMRVGRQP